jgi:hypothetical protein
MECATRGANGHAEIARRQHGRAGNASAILGRVATAMRSTSGVMPDFAIDATAGSPDEWTTGDDNDSCLINPARGTLIEMDCPSGPECGATQSDSLERG